MKTPPAPPAEKLPDPWIFDTEALLRELARCREKILEIPTNGDVNATHFAIQIAVNANWNLEVNLRHILHLHREQQRSIRRQQEQSLTQALSQPAATRDNIVPLHTPAPSNGKAPNNITRRPHSHRERFAKRRRASSAA